MKRVLLVDDDAAVVDYLRESLTARGYDAHGTTSATAALARVSEESFDLVVSDVEMPDMRGTDLLTAILERRPNQLVLLITAYGSVEMAVAAVQAGACDFVTKPFKIEALVHAIERAFSERTLKREVIRLRSALAPSDQPTTMVAKSGAMRKVVDRARRAARADSVVLITGETGTGKSALARFIHENSQRSRAPFVQLNCAAVPPALAESELFGARRGAFTDAREDRQGLFQMAGEGTLFLDEIGELSLEVQAKLLHALESGRVRPLGSRSEVPVNARVIAATNQVPEDLLRARQFRPDLYYRINVVRIEIPPLRERRDDIIPLVDQLLARLSPKSAGRVLGISGAALKRLARHPWHGNVRELANVLERALALSEHDVILPEDLDIDGPSPGTSGPPGASVGFDDHLPLEDLERAYVRHVVEAHGGNKAAAARVLGITRRTLYRKLNE